MGRIEDKASRNYPSTRKMLCVIFMAFIVVTSCVVRRVRILISTNYIGGRLVSRARCEDDINIVVSDDELVSPIIEFSKVMFCRV